MIAILACSGRSGSCWRVRPSPRPFVFLVAAVPGGRHGGVKATWAADRRSRPGRAGRGGPLGLSVDLRLDGMAATMT